MHKIGTLLLEKFCFPVQLILALRVIASFGHVCARDSVRKPGDENKAVHVSCYTWSSFVRLILGHSVILCQWHRHLQQKTWRREWSVITAPKKKMSRSRSQGPGLFRSLDRWEKANRLNQGVGVCVVCASQLLSQLWKWSPMQGFFPPTVKMR